MVIKTDRPLDDKFIIKAANKKLGENHRLQRLHEYYVGRHDILLRHYNDPHQPQNRIVVNYCQKIADVLTSYLCGVPVRYDDAPEIITDNLTYNDNDEITQEIVKSMNIFGFGAELFYTDEDGIPRFASIDPRESIFVIDDTIEELLLAYIRLYPKIDESEGYNVTVYTDRDCASYSLSLSVGELKAAGKAHPHYFGDVPAIMYPNNRELLGSFEGVMGLNDALNKLVSDELNDFESFVDAYLIFTGLPFSSSGDMDIARMKQERVILLEGDARAEWLVKNVNNDHIKELKDNLTRKIREIGHLPDLENLGSFGSSGQAIKFKLLDSEIIAGKQERVVYKGIQRKLELLYNIFKMTDKSIGDYTDISPKFERNFIMLANDRISEKNIDINLVSAGLMSDETFLVKHEGMTAAQAEAEMIKIHGEPKSDYDGWITAIASERKSLEEENKKRKELDINELTKGTATGTGRNQTGE